LPSSINSSARSRRIAYDNTRMPFGRGGDATPRRIGQHAGGSAIGGGNCSNVLHHVLEIDRDDVLELATNGLVELRAPQVLGSQTPGPAVNT